MQPTKAKGAARTFGREIEMERVKLKTEIDRVRRFKEVADKYSAQYFDVCQKLCELKIDQKPDCQYIMDYFKVLVEHGEDFSGHQFVAIYQHLRDNRLLSDDSLR